MARSRPNEMWARALRQNRFDARRPHGRHLILAGVSILCIIIKTQQRETPAAPALIAAPLVKHEELEIGYADHFLHPQGGRNLNGVAERHRSGFLIRLTRAGGRLPVRVAKPRRAHHGVWVGRHHRRERAEIARQFEKSGEASRNKHGRPELRKQDAADPDATFRDHGLGQNRLDLPFRLARVPARMAHEDACMEEMFIAIGLYQVLYGGDVYRYRIVPSPFSPWG